MTTCPRCGKTNLDPEYPHTCTPKALMLAGELESGLPVTGSAAAELRRLYEENEGQADRIQSIYGQLNDTEKEVDDLRLLLKQALEMLATMPVKHPDQIAPRDMLVRLIRERLEGKA